MTELSAKTNPRLFGHETAETNWLAGANSGKLAHGWIISGPRGIGKATLAYRIARMMLSGQDTMEMDAEDNVFRRIATGAHPDFLVVEPVFDEKKGEAKNQISAEQARGIAQFLSMTPAESKWRVVILDSVDQLATAGANAILKILEEPPPQALLLLISHNPGGLLPTIRSRCAMLKLTPLSGTDFSKAMTHLAPDIIEDTLKSLGILSSGSPGTALEYAEQGAGELYGDLLDMFATLPALDAQKIHAFADLITAGKSHARFRLFVELTLILLSRLCKNASGTGVTPISIIEKEILAALSPLHSPAAWATKWREAKDEFSLAIGRHLDYKQVVIVFFHSIANPEPFSLGAAA